MSLAITAAPWTNDNNTNSNVTRRRISNMRRTLKQSRAYTKDDNISTSNNNDLYSSIDVYDNIDENLANGELSSRRNINVSTTGGGANIHEILNKMNKFESMSSDGLADFNPPPKPELNQKKSVPIVGSLKDQNMVSMLSNEGFESTSIPSFDVPIYIPNSSSATPSVSKISAANDLGLYANYKQSYEPPPRGLGYFATAANTSGGNVTMEKLMEKVNYIIHMLEAQQHEKTNNVVEEVILYTFLGVFIIFICDTFALTGKYHR